MVVTLWKRGVRNVREAAHGHHAEQISRAATEEPTVQQWLRPGGGTATEEQPQVTAAARGEPTLSKGRQSP